MAGPFARLRRGGGAGAEAPTDQTPPADAATDPTTDIPAGNGPAAPTEAVGEALAASTNGPAAAGPDAPATEVLPPAGPVGADATEVLPAAGPLAPGATEVLPAVVPGAAADDAAGTAVALDAPAAPDQPADTEPAAGPSTPTFLSRGRMRRRLRYVRRAREIALRDLGGLVFDLHRFDRDRSDLVDQKLAALGALDAEMRALAEALEDPGDVTVLREPGLASCARCGALHASDANFCSTCGLPFGKGAGLPAGPTFAGPAPSPAAAPAADGPPAAGAPPAPSS